LDKEYYKEYYALERENWWFIVRERILKNSIISCFKNRHHLKILNIGVATGASSEMLSEFGEVLSVEYDQDCFEFTRGILSTPVFKGSILDLSFGDDEFDLVCAFDVIEHVMDDQLAIREMNRVCKPEGLCFITVPAMMSLWGKHDEINHHFRRYSLKGLTDTIKKNTKSSILKSTYFNSILFFPAWVFRSFHRRFKKYLPNRKGSGSDHSVIPSLPFINWTLKTIFSIEVSFLKRNFHFPFGVSALCVWRKFEN
jgi:SAM-dependent methyltransferase